MPRWHLGYGSFSGFDGIRQCLVHFNAGPLRRRVRFRNAHSNVIHRVI